MFFNVIYSSDAKPNLQHNKYLYFIFDKFIACSIQVLLFFFLHILLRKLNLSFNLFFINIYACRHLKVM